MPHGKVGYPDDHNSDPLEFSKPNRNYLCAYPVCNSDYNQDKKPVIPTVLSLPVPFTDP